MSLADLVLNAVCQVLQEVWKGLGQVLLYRQVQIYTRYLLR